MEWTGETKDIKTPSIAAITRHFNQVNCIDLDSYMGE